MQKSVVVNDLGRRVGQDHPNAKLTNHEVDLIRQLREDGVSYDTLAKKFEVSRWTIGRICRYEMRAQVVTETKVVHITDETCG